MTAPLKVFEVENNVKSYQVRGNWKMFLRDEVG